MQRVLSLMLMGLCALAAFASSCPAQGGADRRQEGLVSFSREVAPILAVACSNCHGAHPFFKEFSVMTHRTLMKGGESGRAVIPGKPDESPLVQYIEGRKQPRMPNDGQPLNPEEIATIRKWIAQGARADADVAALEVLTIRVPDVRLDLSKPVSAACRVPTRAILGLKVLDGGETRLEDEEWAVEPGEWMTWASSLAVESKVEQLTIELTIRHVPGKSPSGGVFIFPQPQRAEAFEPRKRFEDEHVTTGVRPNPAHPPTDSEELITFKLEAPAHVRVRIWPMRDSSLILEDHLLQNLVPGKNKQNYDRWKLLRSDGSFVPNGTYVVRVDPRSIDRSLPQNSTVYWFDVAAGRTRW